MTKVNPIAEKYKKRYAVQPKEIQERLDELNEMDPDEYQLKVIKRKRVKPQRGDVFIVNPISDIYFYGVVIKSDLNDKNRDGLITVIIFKTKTKEQNMEKFILDFDNVLISPSAVIKDYWTRGYFYNVGKVDLENIDIDYGFYYIGRDYYCDEHYNPIDRIPVLLGCAGITTMTGIAYNMWWEFIIDSNLIDKKELDKKSTLAIRKEAKAAKMKDYLKINNGDGCIDLVFYIEDERIMDIGRKMNQICQDAYMNGYNWELFFESYLEKNAPDILEVIDSDSEAGMYVAYFEGGRGIKKKAKKFAAIIRDLVEHEEKIYQFLREEGDNIEWD